MPSKIDSSDYVYFEIQQVGITSYNRVNSGIL